MTESDLWKRYLKAFLLTFPYEGDASRHEDECTGGIPDVSYGGRVKWGAVNGWIELKAYKNWPKKPPAIVKFSNFTALQRQFLGNRGEAGGHCFLMAVFGRDIIVVDWRSLDAVGTTNKDELVEASLYYEALPLNWTDLAQVLYRK